MAVGHVHRGDPAVRITSAPESPSGEIAARQRRYLISMGIRTVCFVGAIVVGDGWLRWVLIVLALVLPYIAVVLANAAPTRRDSPGLVPTLGNNELQGPSEKRPGGEHRDRGEAG